MRLPGHNLYVIAENNVAWHNHKFLREFLRSSEDAMNEYSELKISLSKKYPNNIEAYIEGKTSFILEILKSSDIPKSSLREIEMQNKAL